MGIIYESGVCTRLRENTRISTFNNDLKTIVRNITTRAFYLIKIRISMILYFQPDSDMSISIKKH